MFGLRSPRAALVALTIGLASSAFGGALAIPSVASAVSPHQAAVIVDTGGTVHRVVITFSEDSISGIDALSRAGASPVIYAMGPGAAVCRLYGVGRDPGPSCLGGQDGDNNYWAYFRAPAGTSKFTYSSIGGGASRVHDGDVEGWKFGTGVAPAFISLASLAPPPPPPPTQPPATAAPAPAGGSAPVGDGGAAPGSGSETVPGQAAAGLATTSPALPATGAAAGASGAAAAGGKESTKGAVDHETDADGKPIHTKLASADNGGSGGSSWSLVLFAVLIVAIAVAIVVVRRVRNRPAST